MNVAKKPAALLSLLATLAIAPTSQAQMMTQAESGLDIVLPDTIIGSQPARPVAERHVGRTGAPILLKSTHERPVGPDHHGDPYAPEGFCCSEPNLGMTLFFIGALEVIPNYFNWRVSDDSTAILSLDSFKYNMTHGFEWDHNNFVTNMFMHPYHGSVYFNSARTHGYNYWASSFFAGLGSFVWEMYGENNRGAINDWVMTTMGGITMGEVLHRSAKMLRDNEARGVGRSMREFGAFLIDPVAGVSRAMRGETSKVGRNPVDRFPSSDGIQVTVGYRRVGTRDVEVISPLGQAEGTPTADTTSTPYVDMTMTYGDFLYDHDRPFDSFRFEVQANFSEKVPIGRMDIRGTLWGRNLKDTEKAKHALVFDQQFLYLENQAAETGGQFFGVSLYSRWKLNDSFTVKTHVQPLFALMTGINSEYVELTGRPYDFGTGGGVQLAGTLFWKNYPVLKVSYLDLFSATINGAKGRHNLAIPGIQGRLQIARSVGVGFDWWTLIRHSFYDEYRVDGAIVRLPDVSRVITTFRINLTFSWFKNFDRR